MRYVRVRTQPLSLRPMLPLSVVVPGGAHAALRLKDMGKSIVLIEQEDILGGNIDSYTAPGSDKSMDFGVFSFIDYGGAAALFQRLNVSTAPPARVRAPTKYVDFTTGAPIPGYTAPTREAYKVAMEKYLSICENDFVKKHGIEDAVPQIYATTGFGIGRQADELTLSVMLTFGAQLARSLLGRQGGFIAASHRNQDVYDAMAREIGSTSIMYETRVVRSIRTPDQGVLLTVKHLRTGTETTIQADKLIMAIRPVGEEAMSVFDLDPQEKDVFSKYEYLHGWATLVRHPSLTAGNTSVDNLPEAVAPSNYLETPRVPYLDKFELQDNTAGGLLLRRREGAAAIILDRLIENGILPPTSSEKEPLEVVAVSDHGPMHLHVAAEEHRNGFYQKLYALQGHRSTWWTGAAFSVAFRLSFGSSTRLFCAKC
ncbi:hypothetical protein PG987_005925 [Apiospora arundinis]